MSMEGWPQPGDDALIVRPYSGSRNGASIKRTTVAKLTKTQCVLADGTRFSLRRVRAGQATLPTGGDWTLPDQVMPPDHPDAVRYLRENALAAATTRLRNAIHELERQARADSRGGAVTAEAASAVQEGVTTLAATRRRYGLPAPVPAAADAGEEQHREDHEDEQDGMDGDAEEHGDGHDQEHDEQVR